MENSEEKKMKEEIPNTSCKGIKIPKTVVIKSTIKNNHKNNDSEADDDGKNKIGKWSKFRKNILPRRMESVMGNVFRKDKLEKPTLFRSSSLKEMLRIEDKNDRKKLSDTKASSEAGDIISPASSEATDTKAWSEDEDIKYSSEAAYKKLSKVVTVNGIKMRRLRSVKMKQKEVKTETEEEKENGGKQELCKKRILMGEKCKPLNVSGVLHYDQNGVLLPEDVS